MTQTEEPGDFGPRQTRALPKDVLLTVVVLLNSLAVAYGFSELRRIQETFKWSVAPALAEMSAFYASQRPPANVPAVVDVYHSFSCEACRASALAIDSSRSTYGDRVVWRFHFISRGPREDTVGFRAATIAACVGPDDAYRLFTSIVGDAPLTYAQLQTAARGIGLSPKDVSRCENSDDALQKVWQSSFRASAVGLKATPTIFVNGMPVNGQIAGESLKELIEWSIQNQPKPVLVADRETVRAQ